ncbi:nucleotide exchange factor GrpE [Ruicaihuangia caeni]|uniref:Protein GrpE n=1 Tax=Ruicaihuangia caeni TaxID=3042517 RepID=A0AAW6T9I8_9MICO|nr:nucleotide exchange factor GrpE [Klugiella sp. YN-L-19]MDI2099019.1 nucleotide exchange factor GrpE [Klugiella sp. YN-L-19]
MADEKNPEEGVPEERLQHEQLQREPHSEDGDTTDAEELIAAEGPDVEQPSDDLSSEDRALLDEAERDLVTEYRERAARAEAELVNFRMRVERDRAANREAVVADVVRSLLPVIDDLDLAEKHGDLVEGSAVALIAEKLRGTFERMGLRRVGEQGEVFDPNFHDAIAQLPTPGATEQTVADVVQVGFALGDRLLRAAKVAVAVPAE